MFVRRCIRWCCPITVALCVAGVTAQGCAGHPASASNVPNGDAASATSPSGTSHAVAPSAFDASSPNGTDATLHGEDRQPQAPPVASFDRLNRGTWNVDIRTVADAAARVIVSPRFHTHMAELTSLRAAPGASDVLTGEQVYRMYVGLDPTAKPAPTSFAPNLNSRGNVLPCEHKFLTRGTGQTGSTAFGAASGSTVLLNQCTFDRARARPDSNPDDLEDFACAVNTVAHEWTHTIYGIEAPHAQLFRDRGRGHAKAPLVSYTVGAVVECTYLESGNHLPGTFAACLQAAGTTILKTETCRKGWAKR